jgi:hypothetical protein
MRLLQLQDVGSFSLIEFRHKDIPPYAILSHTWGPNNEEFTYQDLLNGTGKEKKGYCKLPFCGQQAAKDGLHYFWIDTCCINKDSSTELSEAINSMFRWYHEAVKCYVFLSDVSTTASAKNCVTFRESKWFSRGWTLQELLAPACVEFFSREGDLLGDKHSRVQEISEITNIATEALEGRTMSLFSVEERMAWADRRETTCEEDKAYSLLGIFGIFMSPIYGEGQEHAFKRLRKEILAYAEDDLRQSNSANLLGATHKSSPSKPRTFTAIHAKYRLSILTPLVEQGRDSLDIQPIQNQNQYGTQCNDTISTTPDNKSISSPANRRDCETKSTLPPQRNFESNQGADELVSDTFPRYRFC